MKGLRSLLICWKSGWDRAFAMLAAPSGVAKFWRWKYSPGR